MSLPYRGGVIDLAVFDMAGTTVDDRGAVYDALRWTVEAAGASVAADDLQRWMGTDKEEAIEALLRLGGVTPTQELVVERFDAFREHLVELYRQEPPTPIPGVPDALAVLRANGIRVALTTGFDDTVARIVLDALGWTVGQEAADTVDALVTTSAVSSGRPAPYMIHRAMELTGVRDVRRVLAAGDTIVDVRAAKNAGVIAVGVCSGALDRTTLEAEPHDHVLESVAAVPELLGIAAPATH